MRHRLTGCRQFLIVQNPSLAGLVNRAQPILTGRRLLIQIEESIVTLWGTDEHSPALAIGQRRPDHLGEHILRHLRNLIHHAAIKVNTAQAVRVLSAQQANPRASGQITPQFRLMELDARYPAGELL
jgi:hypothetical protein